MLYFVKAYFTNLLNIYDIEESISQGCRLLFICILLSYLCFCYPFMNWKKQRLSEAFENLSGEPGLELVITVLNVNEGHNTELMQQCSILREYAQYVARVRRFAEITSLDKAVEQAVSECIREGILADFLSRNRAEVTVWKMEFFTHEICVCAYLTQTRMRKNMRRNGD